MKLLVWILASLWLVAAMPASAAVCVEDICIDLTHSSGGVFASLTSHSSTKASPGLVAIEYDPTIDPGIFVGAFNDGGFNCNGSLSPAAGTPTGPGASTTTHLGCDFQLATGDNWHISILITWFFNTAIGQWEVGDIQAGAKQIKSPFQNQVE
jgi:hypothetical protein